MESIADKEGEMKRTGLVSVLLVLWLAIAMMAPGVEPRALAGSATNSVVLQEGQAGYTGTTDVYIDLWTPDQNWGGSDWLMVTATEGRAGLMRFDLAGYVPQGSTVTAATLELYATNRTRALSERVSVYRVLRPWVEREATWNRAAVGSWWGGAGCSSSTDREQTPADTLTVSQLGQWYRFNVTGMVQAWVNDPASNHGLLVKGVNDGLPIEYMFFTSESGMAGDRPILRVDYAPGAPAPDICRVSFDPGTKVVSPSAGAFTLDVRLQNVVDLGGFQFAFNFDPGIVRVQSLALGSLVTGAGRAFTPLGPQIDNVAGSASFGAFSYGSGSGRSGTGPIATITFTPVAMGTSALRFGNVQLTTTGGVAIPTMLENGSIVVQAGLAGDVDGDCDVDVVDIMLVAGRWGATRGSARYDARYDLDGDGDIDITDIMQVVAHWGEHC